MHSPGSVAFRIFGLDVMWYGLLIGGGFLLATIISYLARAQAPNQVGFYFRSCHLDDPSRHRRRPRLLRHLQLE